MRGPWIALTAVVGALTAGGALWGAVASSSPVLVTRQVATHPFAVAADQVVGRAAILSEGKLTLLDTRTGAVAHALGLPVQRWNGTLAIDERAGLSFVSGSGVYAVDTRTGHLRYSLSIPGGFCGLGVDDRRSRLFVACYLARSVRVYDMRHGRLLHTIRVGGFPNAIAVDRRTGRIFVNVFRRQTAPPQVTIDTIAENTGRVTRATFVGPEATIMAIDDRTNRLFVADSAANTVTILDARTGARLRTVPVGRSPLAMAVDAATQRVFVVNQGSSSVTTLDAGSGAFVSTTSVGGMPAPGVAVDEQAGRVYVACNDILGRGNLLDVARVGLHFALKDGGAVAILDARTGASLRTVRMGQGATAVAVDPARARAFVVNSLSNTVSVLDTRAIH